MEFQQHRGRQSSPVVSCCMEENARMWASSVPQHVFLADGGSRLASLQPRRIPESDEPRITPKIKRPIQPISPRTPHSIRFLKFPSSPRNPTLVSRPLCQLVVVPSSRQMGSSVIGGRIGDSGYAMIRLDFLRLNVSNTDNDPSLIRL